MFGTSLFTAGLPSLFNGLHICFQIGALVWFLKSQKSFLSIPPWSSLRNLFSAVLFCLTINDLYRSLPSSISCSLYTDDLTIWSSSVSAPAAAESIQGVLIMAQKPFFKAILKFCTTNKVFAYFDLRYTKQQIAVLNNVVRTREKITTLKFPAAFLKACICKVVAPKYLVLVLNDHEPGTAQRWNALF